MKKKTNKSKNKSIYTDKTVQRDLFENVINEIDRKNKNLSSHISHENHIIDSDIKTTQIDLFENKIVYNNPRDKDFTFDFIDFDEELKKGEDQNLRSEQIYVDNKYYNQILSIMCRCSKPLYNSSIYEIRQAQRENFDKNADGTPSTPEQKELRLKIYDILFPKDSNTLKGYQNEIYELLDAYFRTTNNEYYMSMPQQSAQQTIKLVTDALFSNERSKEEYPKHSWDYTGPPGDIGYKKEGNGYIRGESIAIFTNQQCHIEVRNRPKKKSKNRKKNKIDQKNNQNPFIEKYCLTFPPDLRKQLNIDVLPVEPILTRLKSADINSGGLIDLRHVRIIPLYIGYKIEIVYKKVISEKLERAIENFKEVSKDRIMGIDINVNNTMAIGCLDLSNNNLSNSEIKIIGNHPILIIGKYLKSVNQWFNKVTSNLYSIYMGQQRFTGEKNQTVKMGKKFKILSQNRDNFFKDAFHKLSNFVVKYCLAFKIGTIIIDWSKGIKQNINLGKRINQNFAYIPFSTKLIKMIKYKARQFGIKVIAQNGAFTSLSSFPDDEPFDWTVKNIKDGGNKPNDLGRIFRGLFRTNKGLHINDDVMSLFNQIRKYRIAIKKPINMDSIISIQCKPGDDKSNGVVDGMLHPVSLRIEKLLSEGSKSLISMMLMKKPLKT